MRGLPLRAQLYIALMALAATAAAVWAARQPVPTGAGIGVGLALTVAASVSQAFEVRMPNNKASFNATLAFLLAAALVVGPAAAVVVSAVPFVVDQVKTRKPGYIQVFNVSNHVLSTLAAQAVFLAVAPRLDDSPRAALGAAAAVFTFLALNHAALAHVLAWARNVAYRDSGLFGVEGLLTDATVLSLGVVVAGLWTAGHELVLFALVPFALLQRALHFPELTRASRTDPKTGLANSAYFTELAEEELRRAARFGQSVAVLVADLDLLRNINNAYGHLAGDVVLCGVADVLREEIREYDVAARFGGEEFAVLLPGADLAEATHVAERIRQRVRHTRFDVPTSVTPIQATLSLGVALVGEHGRTLKEVMHAADLAVYRAKVDGRDRVRIAQHGDDVTTAPPTPDRPASPVARLLPAPLAAASHATALPLAPTVPPGDTPVGTAGSDDVRPGDAGAALPPAGQAAPSGSVPVGGPSPAEPTAADGSLPAAPARAGRGHSTLPLTAVVALAALVGGALVLRTSPELGWGLVVFPLLALVAELAGESVYGSSYVSLSAIPILAAVAAGSPGAALAAAVVSALAAGVARRLRVEQVVFNTSTFAFSAAVAAAIRSLAPRHDLLGSRAMAGLVATMLLATTAYFLVDNGLVTAVVALDEGRSPRRVFRDDLAWLLPHFLAFGGVATLVGAGWSAFGVFGLAAFLLPLLLLRVAQRQYLSRTATHVSELRRLADDLRASRDAVERSNSALQGALVQVHDRHLATARALAGAIDARDKTTGGHIERVSALGQAMCEVVDPVLAADPQVVFGFLLHDVGKIGVPDSVLLKPGPLTPEQQEVMRRHPDIGAALMEDAGFAAVAREIVLTHHERWDGTGYPRGLAGTEIPLCSRLFSVADSLDAMTNDRPYRAGMPLEEAFEELRRHSGSQFDPMAVEALLSLPVERVRALLRLTEPDRDDPKPLARLVG